MELDIKLCGEADIEALSEFYRAVIRHLNETVNYPRWKLDIYPSEYEVREWINDESQFAVYADGKLAGAFVLDDDPHGDYSGGKWTADLKTGEFMVIHALAVSHEMSGRGIGSEIVDFCIKTAKTRGYKAIRMDIVPDNYPAIRLYEKKGFTFAGECCVDPELKEIPLFAMYELNL